MRTDETDSDDLRAWARAEGPVVFEELLKLAKDEKVTAVKLAAIREVLDRGYGKTASAAAEETARRSETAPPVWPNDKMYALPDPADRH